MGFKRKLVGLTAALLLLVSGAAVYAQSGQGLEISPPLVELNVDPAKSTSFELKVRNITSSELVVTPTVDDFVAAGEDGQPKLLLNSTEPNPLGLKSWVAALPQIKLAPQEAKSVKITLNVPSDASPGGHYGVVRFTGAAPDIDTTGVSLSASIGSLILANVSGNVVTKASVESFYTAQNGKSKSMFETGPIQFVERIKNEGNVHIKPLGTIRITNTFGKEVGVISINEKGGNVLPNSTRKFEQTFNKGRLFGRYKAEASIQYSGQTMTSSLTFWVIPYKMIAICLGALFLIIAGLRWGIKRYNRMIIKKANGKSESGKPKKK